MTKGEGGGNISKLSTRAACKTEKSQKLKELLKKFLTKKVGCDKLLQVHSDALRTALYLVN